MRRIGGSSSTSRSAAMKSEDDKVHHIREGSEFSQGWDVEPAEVMGLHEIETLTDAAETDAALDRSGEPRRIPPVVSRGAYQVVRDALDAAVCASEASVAIEFMPGALAVQVEGD